MSQRQTWSIARLRALILVALVACVTIYTGVMFSLVRSLSERFGPQVRADLEWRAQRGAQELAKTADLGLALGDRAMVTEAFGAVAAGSDVLAIVAVDGRGRLVAHHGELPDVPLFPGRANELFSGPGYLASWARVEVEGNVVGKVALFISTGRLSAGESLLDNVSSTTMIAGAVSLLLGVIGVLFFTRAVAQRDHRLNDHARTLEEKVEARTRELDERNRGMRLVLDNVAQGFIRVDLHGSMASERSAIVDTWFGTIPADANFGELVGTHDPSYATWFALGLDAIRDDLLPLELCLDQMPRRFVVGERTCEVTYAFLADHRQLLLVVSDVTAELAREHEQREQRELVAVFQRVVTDRGGFEEFLEEADALVASLANDGDPVAAQRAIHTLKGNAASYGVETFSTLCHQIEAEVAETGERLSALHRTRLVDAWQEISGKLARLLGSARDVVEIEHTELDAAIASASVNAATQGLADLLRSWRHEPVVRHLERLAEHAKGLAVRLGKAPLEVAVAAPPDLRIDGTRWAPFWAALVHAVRNAVDHGLESADARIAAGKPANGRLELTVACTARSLELSIADDGGGISWEALRAKARARGLAADTHRDLVDALFADGVSTRDEATDLSGRGVGLAALRAAVRDRGGTIDVSSSTSGTRFTCRFPAPGLLVGQGGRRGDRASGSMPPRAVGD